MNNRRRKGNFQFEEDPFSKNDQGIRKIFHEVIVLMKFLQTKPIVKNMNTNCYDLCYTVVKKRDEKEIVDNQFESDYNSFNDIVPNHYIGGKNDISILR